MPTPSIRMRNFIAVDLEATAIPEPSKKTFTKLLNHIEMLKEKCYTLCNVQKAYNIVGTGTNGINLQQIMSGWSGIYDATDEECQAMLNSIPELTKIAKLNGKVKDTEIDIELKKQGIDTSKYPPRINEDGPVNQRRAINLTHDVFQQEELTRQNKKEELIEIAITKKRKKNEEANPEAQISKKNKKNPKILCKICEKLQTNVFGWTKCKNEKCNLHFCDNKDCQRYKKSHEEDKCLKLKQSTRKKLTAKKAITKKIMNSGITEIN